MNQIKTGRFIAECRKKRGLTQMQLAEKLGITDRAVSKWENGKALPDSSIMLELCGILGITVNDMLSGEVVTMDNYNEQSEKILLDMVRQKEEKDKMLLRMEIIAIVLGIIPILIVAFLIEKISLPEWQEVLIVLLSVIPLLIALPFLIKIEQTAGYYQCKECGHIHIPTYKSVFWATHMGWTRKMKCPNCGKKTWQKKVLTKE